MYNAAMRLRTVRIAWSVAWAAVAVLVCGLWVRSYDLSDLVYRVSTSDALCLESRFGQLSVDKGFAPVRRTDLPGTYHRITKPLSNEENRLAYYPGKSGSRFVVDLYLPGRWRCGVPHWFAALFFGAIAGVTWFPFRFGLRALLIATTLVAVLLGRIVWLLQ
jgi:hypothetical protein